MLLASFVALSKHSVRSPFPTLELRGGGRGAEVVGGVQLQLFPEGSAQKSQAQKHKAEGVLKRKGTGRDKQIDRC